MVDDNFNDMTYYFYFRSIIIIDKFSNIKKKKEKR